MSVAVDSAPADVTANSVTSKTLTTLTVGAGVNRALVVALTLQASASSPSVIWDSGGTNQAMTLIGSKTDTGSNATVYLYGLVAPTSGAKTLSASWTGTSDVTLGAASFTGVNQTGGATSFAHVASTAASVNPITQTVTSATGNYVIGVCTMNGSISAGTPTAWFTDNAPNNFSSAGAYGAGAATVTLSFSASTSPSAIIGVDVVAGSNSYTASLTDTVATSDAISSANEVAVSLSDTHTSFNGPSLLIDFTAGFLPPQVTYTRTGSATYFDASGTMQTVSANVPRFDYDPVTHEPLGILLENAATNVLLNSATLSTQSVSVSATNYVLSFYGTGSITLSGAATGTLNGTGAFPSRAILPFTPSAGTLMLTVSGTVQFSQLETMAANMSGLLATSYIPTTGSAASRGTDNLSVSASQPWFNASTGTMYAEYTMLTGTGFSNVVGLFGSNVNTDMIIINLSQPGITNSIGSGVITAGVTQPGSATSLAALAPMNTGAKFRSLLAYDGPGNRTQASFNGTNSANANAGTLPTITNLWIYGQEHFQNSIDGHVTRVAYWPTALSSAQLQQYGLYGLADLTTGVFGTLSDSHATSDSTTSGKLTSGALSDTTAASDSITGNAHMTATLSDTVVASDAVTGALLAAELLSDIASADDITSAVLGLVASLMDTVATDDSFSNSLYLIESVIPAIAAMTSREAELGVVNRIGLAAAINRTGKA